MNHRLRGRGGRLTSHTVFWYVYVDYDDKETHLFAVVVMVPFVKWS